MTATTGAPPTTEPAVAMGPVVVAIIRRALVAITRVPSAIGPILIMPIFFMVAFAGSYSAIADLPGFPTDNVLDWFVPYACVQGAAFGGMGVGFTTARDLESGFYDRLLLAPINRTALVVGAIGGSIIRSTFPLFTALPLGLVLGADWPGIPGVLLLALAGACMAIFTSLWALGIVYRMKTQRAMGLVQVGIFSSLFLSIGQVPLSVMEGWLHDAARVNPTTNILRMARQGFLDGVTWDLTWPGLVASIVLISVLSVFAATGFRKL
ncbi:MAG: ABC transporter permease [Actinomycetia bacterium]|nr:ABC transporter permease [Actinomycetes bacterium]MCP4084005.1 ABC transporter permease [Actinomycetes bacterium]